MNRISNSDRRALRLLAGAADGCTEAVMLAHGFTVVLLVEPVRPGFATAKAERKRDGGKSIKAARLQITKAGRRALTKTERAKQSAN
jgi:hypothetical protein